MAQFASTLYPQTNPTNVILLAVRNYVKTAMVSHANAATRFLNRWELLMVVEHAPRRQRDHARRVLERVEGFAG